MWDIIAMMNLLDRLVSQLDSLVPFLGLARVEVFGFLRKNYDEWFSKDIQENLPKEYSIYQNQINHSGFLLGYSYFEAFLTDLAREIYKSRPKMIPNDKTLKFSEIRKFDSIDQVFNSMIEKEVLTIFYGSMEEIIKHFENKLQLTWSENTKKDTEKASLIRNCLLHNGGHVDLRLAEISDWKAGDFIILSVQDVHDMGVKARNLSEVLYKQAQEKHFNFENTQAHSIKVEQNELE
jgi:hypothetical protein